MNSILNKINAINVKAENVELPKRLSAKVKAIKSGSKKVRFEVSIFGDDTNLYSDKQIITVPSGYNSRESITAWKDAVKGIYENDLKELISDEKFVADLVQKNNIAGVEFDDNDGTDKTLRDWILR